MGTAIVTTSGKGGTGKTTLAACIATVLASRGKSVLCIDADMGLRNLDLSLAVSDLAASDFSRVLSGDAALEDAALAHPLFPSLRFLSAPLGLEPGEVSREAFAAMVNEAKKRFDWVVTDAPAGLGAGFRLSCAGVDTALIVATADDSSCRDAQRAAAELYEHGITQLRLIINRVKPRLLARAGKDLDGVIDGVGARLIGVVPEDDNVPVSANLGKPLFTYAPKCRAVRAAKNITARLCGEKAALLKL